MSQTNLCSTEDRFLTVVRNDIRKLLALVLIWFAIAAPGLSVSAQTIVCSDWEKVVPSDGLPENLDINKSNNNLDLIEFEGRYYLSFRTAPSHFASDKTLIYVVSSSDMETWQYEHQVHHKNDLREPRFLIYHNKLFLYYFEGGSSMIRFEPQRVWACEMADSKSWTASRNIGLDGFVPWRLRTRNDTIYLSAYYGVGLYTSDHESDLRLFISQDGYYWKPLSDAPQITGSSGEEGEFIFDREGNLWGTVRLESIGALIVYADKHNLKKWKTKYSPYKYDSALMFAHEDDIYLIARRNLDGDGNMDKAPSWFPHGLKKNYNLLRYSFTKKKTALFKLNKANMEMNHIMDFPSTGDTAFPGIVQTGDNTYVVMNYSSDINGNEKNWISGQLGKTYIYKAELRFK